MIKNKETIIEKLDEAIQQQKELNSNQPIITNKLPKVKNKTSCENCKKINEEMLNAQSRDLSFKNALQQQLQKKTKELYDCRFHLAQVNEYEEVIRTELPKITTVTQFEKYLQYLIGNQKTTDLNPVRVSKDRSINHTPYYIENESELKKLFTTEIKLIR